ncbi:glycosyltransferase [Prochlorococcus sp. MIT 1307]|uniref:glycosyltransferase n=1 Tax=Prochlorococcus sp. MIT 1307 TaxID=3096219 RepID=UPI002A758DEF|nr:glycosyltransferase [Prochlorococcus sp. MIT 1307]
MAKPVLTIAVLSKNNEKEVVFTLQSINKAITESKRKEDVEILILDKSDSEDKLRSSLFKADFDFEYYVRSQLSSGIFLAFNECVLNAKTPWIIFINSGDELLNLNSILYACKNNDDHSIKCLIFKVEIYSNSKKFIATEPLFFPRSISTLLRYQFLFPGVFSICHQAVVFSVENHKNNLFKNNELGLDSYLVKKSLKKSICFNQIVSRFYTGGVSSRAPKDIKELINAIISRYKSNQLYSAFTAIIKYILYVLTEEEDFDQIREVRYKLAKLLFRGKYQTK